MKTIRQRKHKPTPIIRYFLAAYHPTFGTPLPITTPGGGVAVFDTEAEAHEYAGNNQYCRKGRGYSVYPFPM